MIKIPQSVTPILRADSHYEYGNLILAFSKSGEFNLEWKRDRYGKKLAKSSTENFNRFYEGNAHKSRKELKSRILDEEEDQNKQDLGKDFDKIRGMGAEVDTSESEPDSESEAESEGDDLYDQAKDEVKTAAEIFPRLAMQNMDWDRIKGNVLIFANIPLYRVVRYLLSSL